MRDSVLVITAFTDDGYGAIVRGTATWTTHSVRLFDWLNAAQLISSGQRSNIINTRYFGFECEQALEFRAYCARLKPSGVNVDKLS